MVKFRNQLFSMSFRKKDFTERSVKPNETTDEHSSRNMAPRDNIPPDASYASESEEDKNQAHVEPVNCPIKHEGRMVINEKFLLPVDELFNLVFSNNPVMDRVGAQLNYADATIGPWEEDPETGLKKRVVELDVPVTQPIGPKYCHLSDRQTMRCCRPGQLYVIEKDSINSGVPYSDSFYVFTHFCLTRVSDSESVFTGYSQLIYRKSVWGLVKSFIEKNVWAGFEDYITVLKKNIHEESSKKLAANGVETEVTGVKESMGVQKRVTAASVEVGGGRGSVTSANETALYVVMVTLLVLLLLNGVMYYKLLASQIADKQPIIHAHMFSEERSHEQWVSLILEQAAQHQLEVHKWRAALHSIVALVRQVEEAIADLQADVRLSGNDAVMAALNPSSNPNDMKTSHNEL